MGKADDYRPYVERVCKEYLGVDELIVDDDGDIPIRLGRAMYYVTVLDGDVPLVRVHSPLVREVKKSAGLFEKVNEINRSIVSARVFWVETADDRGAVIAATEIVAETMDKDELAHACWAVGTLADWADTEIHREFGGRLSFEDDGAAPAVDA